MTEGWYGDDYLVLFEENAPTLERAYGLTTALPGYGLVGLRGWDDFIVEDTTGACFTVPTVPLLPEYLKPFTLPPNQPSPEVDAKVQGRIKWYITPIVLGGDPGLGENVTWVTVEEHVQLVNWWNKKYRDVAEGRDDMPAA